MVAMVDPVRPVVSAEGLIPAKKQAPEVQNSEYSLGHEATASRPSLILKDQP